MTNKGNGGRSYNKGEDDIPNKNMLFYIVAKLNGHFYL